MNTLTPDHRHYSRNHPVTCKVSPKDLAEIESKARQARKSRSSFMRESALIHGGSYRQRSCFQAAFSMGIPPRKQKNAKGQ